MTLTVTDKDGGVGTASVNLVVVNGRPDRLRVRIGTTYDTGGSIALAGGEILIRA